MQAPSFIKRLTARTNDEIEQNALSDQMEKNMADELEKELQKPQMSLLEHQAQQTSKIINRLVGDEARLEKEIAERQEELRQTKISIKAFSSAKEELEAGILEK